MPTQSDTLVPVHLTEDEERRRRESDEAYTEVARGAARQERLLKAHARHEADEQRATLDELLTAMLPTLDSLSLACRHFEGSPKAREGLEITLRELSLTLGRYGVSAYRPQLGRPFDPHRDEAAGYEADTGYEDGAVVEVLRPGYTGGSRLLRPALVTVARARAARPPAVAAVLCGTDLSEAADEALHMADAEARRRGVALHVAMVLPAPISPHSLMPPSERATYADVPAAEREAMDVLERRVAEVTGRDLRGVELEVEHGVPYAALVHRAEELGALLVVGEQGRSGLKRMLLGSVADRAARHAHGPVLIARRSPASGHVLVATDLSEASWRAVSAAAEEASRRGGRLHVLHAIDLVALAGPPLGGAPPVMVPAADGWWRDMAAGARQRIEETLAERQIIADVRVIEGDPETRIAAVAQELPAELVVVGPTGQTGLARLLLGSVAEGVIRTAPCSVLVAR